MTNDLLLDEELHTFAEADDDAPLPDFSGVGSDGDDDGAKPVKDEPLGDVGGVEEIDPDELEEEEEEEEEEE